MKISAKLLKQLGFEKGEDQDGDLFELTSCDFVLYQSNKIDFHYEDEEGNPVFVATLNQLLQAIHDVADRRAYARAQSDICTALGISPSAQANG